MKGQLAILAGLAVAGAGAAHAGGIDRSGQSLSPLFETGDYAEFSLGYVSPTVSGTQVQTLSAFSTAGAKSGDMAGGYMVPGFAFKKHFSANLDAALIYDQPFGAKIDYPTATSLPAYFANGSTAVLSTNALTGVLKYKFDSNVSVYGGVRWQTMREHVSIPLVADYTGVGSPQGAFGYVAGIAYERPDIALRVALTYNSAIKYDVPTYETYAGGTLSSTTPVKTPQSINLDAQTGINPTTLVFGSVRWVDWRQFKIAPTLYSTLTGETLIGFHGNTTTFTLGVGHKFTDHWSGAVSVSFEPKIGGFSSNLGPKDGQAGVGLGATYAVDEHLKITAGVSYIRIGNTTTTVDNVNPASDFSGNHAVAAGIKVGYTF